MEMYEAVIPVDVVTHNFGLTLTPLEDVAKRLFVLSSNEPG